MQQLKIEQKNDVELCNLMMKELELISKVAIMVNARMSYITPAELEALK